MIKVGGFQSVSLIDYPGKICSIVFTIGCNMRCPFCHNSELVLEEKIKQLKLIPWRSIVSFLKKKQKFIDAVEFTGGEPLLQEKIADAAKEIKKLGFAVKLDTNGFMPEKLEKLLAKNLVDYIAMDVKAKLTKENYSRAAGIDFDDNSLAKIKKSINILKRAKNIAVEFRTTAVPKIVELHDFVEIAKSLKGAKLYSIQQFIPENTLSKEFEKIKPYSKRQLEEIVAKIKEEGYVEKVELKNF